MIERSRGPPSDIPALGPAAISAMVVKVNAGVDPAQVQSLIARWPDVTVYSFEDQRELLLGGMVDRSRRQLGLFRILSIIVSAIIMALILDTLTLDRLHDVAMLKLMGARNSVILNLILQQALLLGALAYGVGYVIGQWAFLLFRRRVIVTVDDLWLLAGIVLGISVVASLLGIYRALSVEPNEVLS